MALTLYNTLTRQKETFKPLKPGHVSMYVCGPTVYDSSHIGHARSAVVFDIVFRYLQESGYEVTYVRNFTDVDDKIINRANERDMDCQALSEIYIDEFHRDMDALAVLRPTLEPRATEFIKEIIEVTSKLVEKGHAYVVDGDVYFDVRSFESYGKLSGRKLEDMEAGARVKVDSRKKDPFDFALWKAKKPGEPAWESPWGEGRPGWHIECSAMSWSRLGETFDIHGGGQDLIFPHHENEVAQSEAAFGQQFVRYWMHNGFVNIDSEKMSKSLNNFLTVKEILDQFHPEAVRLFLLSKHYRSPVDFTEQAMKEAASGLDRVYSCLQRILESVGGLDDDFQISGHWSRFCACMDDDFNTAGALGILFEAVRDVNRLLDGDLTGDDQVRATEAGAAIVKMGGVLGMFQEDPVAYFEGKKEQAAQDGGFDPAMVDDLIAKRSQARKDKDWNTADAIRDQLTEMGVAIEDTPDGTIWKMA
ncbi:Cysteinyl-tRNA synthetase [Desulfatibacillum aliphaticivorans]|uniref:Cysteine--tRNA ligase n=1 Tax=Desulfatibacillum aliphaticivorans TaxID=218208 RepID=B8FHQ7_DESAL|nr:cysteine--tRNA ligase [Desulfatibacillum aliphaticivorans]ACL02474.1 Cysteinyl-tRNA synthetase [Desulfatibacillum aliphaticivorans]